MSECKFISFFNLIRKLTGNYSIWLEFLNVMINLQFKETTELFIDRLVVSIGANVYEIWFVKQQL